MFCSKCGSKLDEGDKFCRVCGTLTNPNDANAGQSFGNQSGPQYHVYSTPSYTQTPVNYANVNIRTGGSKKNIILIAAAAGAVVIIGVILFFVLSSQGKPSSIVQRFVDGINSRNVNTVLSCVDQVTAKEIAVDSFDNLTQSNARITITKILSENETGDSATVVASTVITQKDSDGETNTDTGDATFYLEKINGQWKITNIE